ncbi:MAG: beta-1,6-N-acetylglucosaminyltransferase [Hyphomicrobiaceae bacterium]
MRLAFVLQTHRSLEQIAHLVRTLDQGLAETTIVISHNGPVEECRQLARVEGVDRVLPAPGGRAQFSMLDGLFSAFRWLEAQPLGYDWALVLSGQDYPIRPLGELEQLLRHSPYDGLFHHFEAAAQGELPPESISWTQQEVETRYYFRATRLKRELSLFDRAMWKPFRLVLDRSQTYRLHTGFGLHFCRRAYETPFNAGFKLYGGSNWLTVRRGCVQRILRFVDERPDLTEYFRHTIAPDEAFPVSVLANDPSIHLSTEELRYYDFSVAQNNSPATITPDNLGEALASGKFFARKFDMAAYPEVIRHIDEHFTSLQRRRSIDEARLEDEGRGRRPAGARPS